ncbi:hypothetical protein QGM71_09810 [Virgibacillus sp. C22-A2]|uniref:Uncharacterized protein n=1 Tax=Virgibacillus tibetensis TaxID=3042313 RepID=A0ABU6KEN3_9BACI|nr:hypothetical protein [Virgibacillus sp. C22-A2]
METLSTSFWIFYYIFLFLTLAISTFCYIRQLLSTISVIALILSLATPLISFVFSVQRTEGVNEYHYLVSQIQEKDAWAIFISLGYTYLIVWWIVLLTKLFIHFEIGKHCKNLYIKLSDQTKKILKKSSS